MTGNPNLHLSRDNDIFPISPELLKRVADQVHSRECSVYDGRNITSCCRGRDWDLRMAHLALVDVIRSLRQREALRWDARIITQTIRRPGTVIGQLCDSLVAQHCSACKADIYVPRDHRPASIIETPTFLCTVCATQ